MEGVGLADTALLTTGATPEILWISKLG